VVPIKKAFLSRSGLLKNLQKHLIRGGWAALVGGAMIGKSTLAARLSKRINLGIGEGIQAEAIFLRAKEMKPDFDFYLSLPRIEKIGLSQPPLKRILLIDDCEQLIHCSKERISKIIEALGKAQEHPAGLHAVCWVGGLSWGDWIANNAGHFPVHVRLYPLSVVPIREAHAIIRRQLGPEEVARIWRKTGGHPLLLEQCLGGTEETPGARGQLKVLSKRLSQDLRETEKAILAQLDPEGGWTAIDDLRSLSGRRPEKQVLNRLCTMGLIVRTLDQGLAVVRRTSAHLLP